MGTVWHCAYIGMGLMGGMGGAGKREQGFVGEFGARPVGPGARQGHAPGQQAKRVGIEFGERPAPGVGRMQAHVHPKTSLMKRETHVRFTRRSSMYLDSFPLGNPC